MKRRAHTRRLSKIALGIAVAAIVAPSAQAYYFGELGTASNVPSNEPGSQTVVPSKPFPTLEELGQFRFTPSETSAGPTAVMPDPTRGLPSLEELQKFSFTPAPVVGATEQIPSDGIDWTDAGVGAGIGVVSVLVAAAAVFGLRRSRRLAHS
jgi:hypothetical protein